MFHFLMKMMMILILGLPFTFLDSTLYLFFVSFLIAFIFLQKSSFMGIFIMDEISFCMIFLTWSILLFCWYSDFSLKWNNTTHSGYIFNFLLIFLFLELSFVVKNFILFYVSLEVTFVLMFVFLISWGYSPERFQASFYMLFYTIVVSFPFFGFLIYSSEILKLSNFFLFGECLSFWWFFLIAVFLVKLPAYNFHVWLPKAHVEAPLGGSMMLAGIMLKLATYGILRVVWMVPHKITSMGGYLVSLSITGAFLSCLTCMRQVDLKAYVAYSSICHMGIAAAGIFSGIFWGYKGILGMSIAHGFCSSALFFLVNTVYKRFLSRSLFILKGMGSYFSFFSYLWFSFSVLNLSVPPSLAFFSEIFLMASILSYSLILMPLIFMFLFLCGIYCIYFFITVNHSSNSETLSTFLVYSREILILSSHFLWLFFFSLVMNFFI